MLITVLVPSLRANLRTVCTDFSSIDREECRNVKCKGHRVENFNYDCYCLLGEERVLEKKILMRNVHFPSFCRELLSFFTYTLKKTSS